MPCHLAKSKDNGGPFRGKQFFWRLRQTQSTLFNLAKYDLTNLFCFLGKPIVYYILEFKVRKALEPTMSTKRRREKKRNLERVKKLGTLIGDTEDLKRISAAMNKYNTR